MGFLITKILGFMAAPSNALMTVGLVGVLAILFGARGTGAAMTAAAIGGLAVFGLTPLANILILPLEQRFPRAPAEPAPHGIVVLGGAFDTVVSRSRGSIALTDAAERMTEVAELARRWPQARIVFSGGSNAVVYEGANESETAARMFESFGISRDRLILESRSRNTVENARFTRELVQPKPEERWVLVTSAYHVPRAVGCFRAAGFPVEAWPVDYRTRGWDDAMRFFPTVSGGLRRTDVAVREWVGLVAYWLLGYVTDPLPRP